MAGYAHPESLVSTQWLARHLGDPDIRVADATYFLPSMGKNLQAEFEARHIPGSVLFDIDAIADRDNPLPHMLPSAEKFASHMRKLGIGDGNRVIVYDAHGLMSATRAWWMLRIFGHDDVALLDGGLPKWIAEGRPVEEGPAKPRERHFTARFDHGKVRDKAQMKANMASKREQVLDARASPRFTGSEPDLWPGRRRGHIPGSHNLPFADLLNPTDKTLMSADQLTAKFRGAGIDLKKPVIATCGSGVTATVLAFGLHLLGHRDVAVYDGSWAEWGLPGDTPVET
jgi:thiosulfate/3-mercaptopyruvate sulfurtransferase